MTFKVNSHVFRWNNDEIRKRPTMLSDSTIVTISTKYILIFKTNYSDSTRGYYFLTLLFVNNVYKGSRPKTPGGWVGEWQKGWSKDDCRSPMIKKAASGDICNVMRKVNGSGSLIAAHLFCRQS
ncbi:hypothetical protein CEXT_254171 [Caerostris extrusa]|uniref:Uncharacterized protein n=1 Tax=Caerostris extrusa TaxID=172846 RepID=A0AAV4X1H3_CAEEX|nr:hypothetical protein CEXT_254171 [Caerostris extrusa]